MTNDISTKRNVKHKNYHRLQWPTLTENPITNKQYCILFTRLQCIFPYKISYYMAFLLNRKK